MKAFFDNLVKSLDVEAFVDSLSYMGKGMLGIFIITVVIILAVYLINKIGSAGNNQQ